jgi:putative acetyltransferase
MYILRKASKGDKIHIIQLIGRIRTSYKFDINLDEIDSDLVDLDKSYFNNNGWFAVVESAGKIIGTYGLIQKDREVCELRKMYLLPGFRGKGFGKIMIEDVLIKSRLLGYKQIVLETNKVLETAIGVYKKYGFEEITCEDFSGHCDYAMRKILS